MTPSSSDRDILVSALQVALAAFEQSKHGKTLLGQHPPDESLLAPLADAIEECEVFKPIRGRSLYSGNSGVVLHASSLATSLLYRADRKNLGDRAAPDAADWLIRVLETRKANGVFVAVIWGLAVDRGVEVAKGMTLIPFDQLADTLMKRRVVERARKTRDDTVWLSHQYFGAPGTALVSKIADFPYIGSPDESFRRLTEIESEARDPLVFLQAHAAGQPLAVGSWFEYEDADLDLNDHENHLSWFLPEIVPRVESHVSVCSTNLKRDADAFWCLPPDWRSTLLRSMDRFVLSQCRRQIVDRALDLAIAFEIAVGGGKGDNAPASWKVAVRSAQLIGGNLDQRHTNRKALTSLYELRSKGGHGGSLKELDRRKHECTLTDGASLYRTLLSHCLSLSKEPNWQLVELEPPPQERIAPPPAEGPCT